MVLYYHYDGYKICGMFSYVGYVYVTMVLDCIWINAL